MRETAFHVAVKRQTAAKEREAIVAYLRRMSSRRLATEAESWLLCSFANCIEAEDHHL